MYLWRILSNAVAQIFERDPELRECGTCALLKSKVVGGGGRMETFYLMSTPWKMEIFQNNIHEKSNSSKNMTPCNLIGKIFFK
jgi:hypothetical protein